MGCGGTCAAGETAFLFWWCCFGGYVLVLLFWCLCFGVCVGVLLGGCQSLLLVSWLVLMDGGKRKGKDKKKKMSNIA